MSRTRFVLFIALILNLLGCRPALNTEPAKGLLAQGNELLEEDVRSADKWIPEYGRLFTPQNRAKFPSNRQSLRADGDRLIRCAEKSSILNEIAAEKFDQAAGLVTEDKAKKGLNLFAATLRENVEINNLMKEQMLLAADEEIKDQEVFNEKFIDLMTLIQLKRKELEDQRSQAKMLLGW